MKNYVMSDIHGCFDAFKEMLQKIELTGDDRLILAGDYIDRGKQSYEMLKWMERNPVNAIMLKGNHDVDFVKYIDRMLAIAAERKKDQTSLEDTRQVYRQAFHTSYFDQYDTVGELIDEHGVTLKELQSFAEMIRKMPYFFQFDLRKKRVTVVHAGYTERLPEYPLDFEYGSLEEFYIWAREDAYLNGGEQNGIIVAGHTPTCLEDAMTFNNGNIFHYYNAGKNCHYYNVDCGAVFKGWVPGAKLACLRIDDMKEFYL